MNDIASAPDATTRLFLAVEALEEKVTATEDTLAWVQVLDRWVPDLPEHSLYELLDGVEVRRKDEDEVRGLLKVLSVARLRELMHLTPEAIAASGLQGQTRDLDGSLQSIASGLRRLHDFRTGRERRVVDSFNKSKHVGLGYVEPLPGGELKVAFYRATPPNRRAQVTSLAGPIEQVCQETIGIQAVLCSVLYVILVVRYGHHDQLPLWVPAAYHLPQAWAEPELDAQDVATRLDL